MEVIYFDKSQAQKLYRICDKTKEANLYHDDKKAYKLYLPEKLNVSDISFRRIIRKKIQLLNQITDIPNAVMPEQILYDDRGLVGFSMKYIPNATRLSGFGSVSNDGREFMDLVALASQTLRQVHAHSYNLCIPDFHFSNIIFNEKMIPYFIDCDSWNVGIYNGSTRSIIYKEYCKYKWRKNVERDVKADRISLYLSVYQMIMNHSYIKNCSIQEYDRLAEKSDFLASSREVFITLMRGKFSIPDVPYIDEFINPEGSEQIKIKQIDRN